MLTHAAVLWLLCTMKDAWNKLRSFLIGVQQHAMQCWTKWHNIDKFGVPAPKIAVETKPFNSEPNQK